MSEATAQATTWEIEPYVGVGPIRFGMTREEVRRAVGQPATEFRKDDEEPLTTDAFDATDGQASVHVYYRAPGVCEFVEFGGAFPAFRGQTFRGQTLAKLRAWLEALDPEVEAGDTLISRRYGISLWFASDRPRERVQSVAVFERGYYDRE